MNTGEPITTIRSEGGYPDDMGWSAFRKSYEPPDSDGIGGGLVGWGKTEIAAIADLLDREAESGDQVLFSPWSDSEPPVSRGRFAPRWWIVPAVIVGIAAYGALAAWLLQRWGFR